MSTCPIDGPFDHWTANSLKSVRIPAKKLLASGPKFLAAGHIANFQTSPRQAEFAFSVFVPRTFHFPFHLRLTRRAKDVTINLKFWKVNGRCRGHTAIFLSLFQPKCIKECVDVEVKSDIEIAQACAIKPFGNIAAVAGVDEERLSIDRCTATYV